MARIGIILGVLLCGLTYAGLISTTAKNPIQFIPMMIGIPTLFCGVVALNPHRRKHAMRAAATLALLGTSVGSIRSLVWLTRWMRDEEIYRYAAGLNIAMMVISGTFLVIFFVSFLQERRRYQQELPSIPLHPSAAKEKVESRDIA